MALLEVCADTIASCIAAQEGGAGRIELCSALQAAGLTPSAGLFMEAAAQVQLPIYPIIRPREGDFLYSEQEVRQMLADIHTLRQLGADGFVVGALTPDGRLEHEVCKALIEAADGRPVTLHRAFDMSSDLSRSLEEAIDLGFSRILTSGGKPTAEEGIPVIRTLVQQAAGRIVLMAGSGLSLDNVQKVKEETGVSELHGSFRRHYPSTMQYRNHHISMGGDSTADEYSLQITDPDLVRKVIKLL